MDPKALDKSKNDIVTSSFFFCTYKKQFYIEINHSFNLGCIQSKIQTITTWEIAETRKKLSK